MHVLVQNIHRKMDYKLGNMYIYKDSIDVVLDIIRIDSIELASHSIELV